MSDFSGADFNGDFLADADGVLVAAGSAAFDGLLTLVEGEVFATHDGLSWSPTVLITGIDVSSRLSGRISISGGEDAARVATLEVMPESAAELESWDSAPLTIDITVLTAGGSATLRRFTGRVEAVDPYDPVARTARIAARDGWQERPAACSNAAQVEALFGGLARPCADVVKWDDSNTDNPGAAYFNALLPTMMGATAIDSNGLWRAFPWRIGEPAERFGTGDLYDASLQLRRPSRKSTPKEIRATLSHQFHRLHATALNVHWTSPTRTDVVVYGVPLATKSIVIDAINQLASDGWLATTEPKIKEPIPGSYSVIVGGQSVPFIISSETAQLVCDTVDVSLYRRWYQQATARYTVTIDMGGMSERDDGVNVSISSDFDASGWESPPTATAAPSVYAANGPATPSVPVGFAALRGPWPPVGGALDHLGASFDMSGAIDHVVALAVRRAAAGKREQQVRFERPIDPRWEIGDVLAVDCYGVKAVGQIVAFEDTLDIDSGEALSAITLACPEGSPGAAGGTAYQAAASLPPPNVSNNYPFPAPATYIGAMSGMGPPLGEAGQRTLNGFLCNVLPTSAAYNANAPRYETQWRLVAPEIPGSVRDPLDIDVPIDVRLSFSGSGVEVSMPC